MARTVGETGREKRRFRDEIEGRDVGDVDGFESHFFFFLWGRDCLNEKKVWFGFEDEM
jgi:hypothetical protein